MQEDATGIILADIKTIMDESLPLGVQIMIGLPGQTMESSLSDIRKLAESKGPLSWDLRIYPCLVIEGTELESMMRGKITLRLKLDQAIEWGAVWDPPFRWGSTRSG